MTETGETGPVESLEEVEWLARGAGEAWVGAERASPGKLPWTVAWEGSSRARAWRNSWTRSMRKPFQENSPATSSATAYCRPPRAPPASFAHHTGRCPIPRPFGVPGNQQAQLYRTTVFPRKIVWILRMNSTVTKDIRPVEQGRRDLMIEITIIGSFRCFPALWE